MKSSAYARSVITCSAPPQRLAVPAGSYGGHRQASQTGLGSGDSLVILLCGQMGPNLPPTSSCTNTVAVAYIARTFASMVPCMPKHCHVCQNRGRVTSSNAPLRSNNQTKSFERIPVCRQSTRGVIQHTGVHGLSHSRWPMICGIKPVTLEDWRHKSMMAPGIRPDMKMYFKKALRCSARNQRGVGLTTVRQISGSTQQFSRYIQCTGPCHYAGEGDAA